MSASLFEITANLQAGFIQHNTLNEGQAPSFETENQMTNVINAKWGSAGFNAAHQFDNHAPCFEHNTFSELELRDWEIMQVEAQHRGGVLVEGLRWPDGL